MVGRPNGIYKLVADDIDSHGELRDNKWGEWRTRVEDVLNGSFHLCGGESLVTEATLLVPEEML